MGIGLQISDLKVMIITAVRAAFLPPDKKAALEDRFRKELGI